MAAQGVGGAPTFGRPDESLGRVLQTPFMGLKRQGKSLQVWQEPSWEAFEGQTCLFWLSPRFLYLQNHIQFAFLFGLSYFNSLWDWALTYCKFTLHGGCLKGKNYLLSIKILYPSCDAQGGTKTFLVINLEKNPLH